MMPWSLLPAALPPAPNARGARETYLSRFLPPEKSTIITAPASAGVELLPVYEEPSVGPPEEGSYHE